MLTLTELIVCRVPQEDPSGRTIILDDDEFHRIVVRKKVKKFYLPNRNLLLLYDFLQGCSRDCVGKTVSNQFSKDWAGRDCERLCLYLFIFQ